MGPQRRRSLPRRLASVGLVTGLLLAVGLPAAWSVTRPDPQAGSPAALGRVLDLPAPPDAPPRAVGSNEEIGTRNASIDALGPVRRSRPVAVRIPAIGVVEPIRPVGIDAEGAMALPSDPYDVGWYRFGPAPGEPGSAVLAGHVDWNGREGPFFRLRELAPGDTVTVGFGNGSTRRFEVVARRVYGKDDLPARAFARDGGPLLTMITCGGVFDPAIGRYLDNVVVYAVPAGGD